MGQDLISRVVNIFCPTGKGGGIKPDCKAGQGGVGGPSKSQLDASERASKASMTAKGGGKNLYGESPGDLAREASKAAVEAAKRGDFKTAKAHHQAAAAYHQEAVGNFMAGRGGRGSDTTHRQAAQLHETASKLY